MIPNHFCANVRIFFQKIKCGVNTVNYHNLFLIRTIALSYPNYVKIKISELGGDCCLKQVKNCLVNVKVVFGTIA